MQFSSIKKFKKYGLTILLNLFLISSGFGQKIEIIPRSLSLKIGTSYQLSTNSKNNSFFWSTNNPNIEISNEGLISTKENNNYPLNKSGKIYLSNNSKVVIDSIFFSLVNWTTNKSSLTDLETYKDLLFLGFKNDSVFSYNFYTSPHIYLSNKDFNNTRAISPFHKIKTPTFSNFLSNKFGYIIKDSTDISFSKNLKDWKLVYKTRTNSFRNSSSQYYDSLNNKIYFFTGDYHTIDSLPCSVYRGEISNEGIKVEPVYTFSSRTEYRKNTDLYPQARHVHLTAVDPYTKDIWFGTGDNDNENFLMYSQDNGKTWNVLGTGSQEWRTLSIWFTKNYIYWNMDSWKNQKVFRIPRTVYKVNNSWPNMTPILKNGYTKPGVTYFIKEKGNSLNLTNNEGTFFIETKIREINDNTELIACNDPVFDYREVAANLENSAHWLTIDVLDKKGDHITLMSTDAEGKILDDKSRIFGFKERIDGTLDVQEVFSVKSTDKYTQMMPCFQNSEKSIFYWGYYTDWRIHKMELEWNDNSESVGGIVKEDNSFKKTSNMVKLELVDYDGEIIKWQYSDKSMEWKDIDYQDDTLTIQKLTGTFYYRALVQKENQPPVSSVPAKIVNFIWTDTASINQTDNKFKITPNPAMNYLIVNGLNVTDNNVSFEIYNIEGGCIFQKTLYPESNRINENVNLPNFSSGIYIAKIHGTKSSFTQKVLLY
jgi:hypothetical protein